MWSAAIINLFWDAFCTPANGSLCNKYLKTEIKASVSENINDQHTEHIISTLEFFIILIYLEEFTKNTKNLEA